MKAEELFDKTIGFEGLERYTENYDSFDHVRSMIITIMKEYEYSRNKELKELNDFLKEQINSGKLMFFAQRDKNQYLKLIKK